MASHAFIVGGTGQLGRAIAAELLEQGWNVTLSSRNVRAQPDDLISQGVATSTLDREQPGSLLKALRGGVDAVIDTVAYTEGHADQLLEVQADVGAFVVISSCSVYRDARGRTLDEAAETGFPDFPGPVKENQPTVEPGPATYSTRKAALERRLLDRARRPVTILRPGAIHGPYSSHPREWWFVKRMLDERKVIPLSYRGTSQLHTAAVANIAKLIRVTLNHKRTCVLNAADPEAPSVHGIGTLIARHLDYRGALLPIDVGDDKGYAPVGWSPWSIARPFVLSTDAAEACGYTPATTYATSIGRTCDWLVSEYGCDWKQRFPVLASYPRELFDYAAEDRFLAEYERRSS